MHAAHQIPDVALARVLTSGGPYRPGDELSLGFGTQTVCRLVAHDTDVRATCVPPEGAVVPEMISVVVIHSAAPYAEGDVLTLSFVDPRIARVQRSPQSRRSEAIARDVNEPVTFAARSDDVSVTPEGALAPRDATSTAPLGATLAMMSGYSANRETLPAARDDSGTAPRDVRILVPNVEPFADMPTDAKSSRVASEPQPSQAAQHSPHASPSERDSQSSSAQGRARALVSPIAGDDLPSPAPEGSSAAESPGNHPMRAADSGASRSFEGARDSAQLHAGERMTLRENEVVACDGERVATIPDANGRGKPSFENSVASARRPTISEASSSERVTVRLEWTSERLRRFVQVVDKLFTIDRLGWYRHSLAMRLLVPDEIACGDTLATVEAMRHLHALRTAAVECLGKPLLAACMPGFGMSSEWLETLESAREARAISGLRDALLPYADDREEPVEPPAGATLCTLGTIARRELLAESATSVEAFLPLLIPTVAHDAELSVRLGEYRRLLVELFTQTARASEQVRLHQMAQPNHSLDDRLWQLVGAAAEAFGGFAHA